ncbi:MAG: hypothetical protein J07HX5_01478 [halophilic archaeon J07HX5]|jgi:hypothetical protein|nr:MAG: hypothetical protein J07HX5_01478 [halophilic archaeon J07HX5]
MTAFDPEKFDQKFDHYFTELQQAYSRAFQTMHAEYDSGLVHAIDQQVLAESEPVYEGDGHFRIELGDDPASADQLRAEYENLAAVLETYCDELEHELRVEFEFADE